MLPVALVFAFGRMVGDLRQGRVLLIAMTVIFAIALVFFYWAETRGNPALTGLGVDSSFGNMEGKDLRFGQAGAALFVDACDQHRNRCLERRPRIDGPGRGTGRHVQPDARLHLTWRRRDRPL